MLEAKDKTLVVSIVEVGQGTVEMEEEVAHHGILSVKTVGTNTERNLMVRMN